MSLKIFLKVCLFSAFIFLQQRVLAQTKTAETEGYCLSCRTSLSQEMENIEQQTQQLIASTCGDWVPGVASYYGKGDGFLGKKTANGEILNSVELTAAHRSLPFNTYVMVRVVGTTREVLVRINDRGPYSHGRLIDLNYAAAKKIGLDQAGVAKVEIKSCGFENAG